MVRQCGRGAADSWQRPGRRPATCGKARHANHIDIQTPLEPVGERVPEEVDGGDEGDRPIEQPLEGCGEPVGGELHLASRSTPYLPTRGGPGKSTCARTARSPSSASIGNPTRRPRSRSSPVTNPRASTSSATRRATVVLPTPARPSSRTSHALELYEPRLGWHHRGSNGRGRSRRDPAARTGRLTSCSVSAVSSARVSARSTGGPTSRALRVGRQAVVASYFPHFGEEDCLSAVAAARERSSFGA